jgi:hypothetical protein
MGYTCTIFTVIEVDAVFPLVSVATMVHSPALALDGIVTDVENEPLEFDSVWVVTIATPTQLRVRVIVSCGAKFSPLTPTVPPGDETEVLMAIIGAWGP